MIRRMARDKGRRSVYNLSIGGRETLTGSPPRVLNYVEEEYCETFPKARAAEPARFQRPVRRGLPHMGTMLTVDRGASVPAEYTAALAAQQLYDVERSAVYAREVLGMGESAGCDSSP